MCVCVCVCVAVYVCGCVCHHSCSNSPSARCSVRLAICDLLKFLKYSGRMSSRVVSCNRKQCKRQSGHSTSYHNERRERTPKWFLMMPMAMEAFGGIASPAIVEYPSRYRNASFTALLAM
jgi:hypothetical protein